MGKPQVGSKIPLGRKQRNVVPNNPLRAGSGIKNPTFAVQLEVGFLIPLGVFLNPKWDQKSHLGESRGMWYETSHFELEVPSKFHFRGPARSGIFDPTCGFLKQHSLLFKVRTRGLAVFLFKSLISSRPSLVCSVDLARSS